MACCGGCCGHLCARVRRLPPSTRPPHSLRLPLSAPLPTPLTRPRTVNWVIRIRAGTSFRAPSVPRSLPYCARAAAQSSGSAAPRGELDDPGGDLPRAPPRCSTAPSKPPPRPAQGGSPPAALARRAATRTGLGAGRRGAGAADGTARCGPTDPPAAHPSRQMQRRASRRPPGAKARSSSPSLPKPSNPPPVERCRPLPELEHAACTPSPPL